MAIRPAVGRGHLARLPLTKKLVGRTTQDGGPSVPLHFLVSVQARQQLFIEGDLYATPVSA
ncbi:MAG TPA: hypothetical protein VNT81_06610 [Vicinamibacterales bacterium]|nr:hypothetical protein [Vicinamibacterales bacterium]